MKDHMIKPGPSLKTMEGACSVASEDENHGLAAVNQILFIGGYLIYGVTSIYVR